MDSTKLDEEMLSKRPQSLKGLSSNVWDLQILSIDRDPSAHASIEYTHMARSPLDLKSRDWHFQNGMIVKPVCCPQSRA